MGRLLLPSIWQAYSELAVSGAAVRKSAVRNGKEAVPSCWGFSRTQARSFVRDFPRDWRQRAANRGGNDVQRRKGAHDLQRRYNGEPARKTKSPPESNETAAKESLV